MQNGKVGNSSEHLEQVTFIRVMNSVPMIARVVIVHICPLENCKTSQKLAKDRCRWGALYMVLLSLHSALGAIFSFLKKRYTVTL